MVLFMERPDAVLLGIDGKSRAGKRHPALDRKVAEPHGPVQPVRPIRLSSGRRIRSGGGYSEKISLLMWENRKYSDKLCQRCLRKFILTFRPYICYILNATCSVTA